MKRNTQNKRGNKCATLVMALPLAVAGLTITPNGVQALPLASGLVQNSAVTQTATASSNPIKNVAKINPTTVEVTYADGKQLTVDFYGDNIFRLFRDDNVVWYATRRPLLPQRYWWRTHAARHRALTCATRATAW